MLEIIALIFITKDIGRLAASKGLPPGKWKVICVVLWFVLEIIGLIVALMFFRPDNIISIALVALGFAFLSYVLIKNHLQKLPDVYDDIDNIGSGN